MFIAFNTNVFSLLLGRSNLDISNSVSINWKNGTSTLDRLYTYKIELYISNDTNTNASAVYVLRDSANYASDTASWNLRMVSRTGTSSNHVAVEVASAGTVIQLKFTIILKHFHEIRKRCEFK